MNLRRVSATLLCLATAVALALAVSSAGSDSTGEKDRHHPVRASATLPPDALERQPRLVATLEHRLRDAVPGRFGCVVLPTYGDPAVIRLIPDRRARRRVRRIVRDLDVADEVSIQTAPREESDELRQDLLRRLRADAPDGVDDVRVGPVAGESRCPLVVIQLPGDASADVEAWAATMVNLFGTRRVRIEYVELNYLDPEE